MLTVAETWDGSSWTLDTSPNPANGSLLQGVSCGSSQDCTAVGEAPDAGGVEGTLIETGD